MAALRRLAAFILAFFPVLFIWTGGVNAASEEILYFQSRVQVHPDASLTVTETIKVRAARRQIKRGIIREFPTTYRDRSGRTVRVGFQVEEVRRNGRPEPYQVRSAANGAQIYIGRKDVFLRPGIYTYTIKYRTDRQLGFFPDYDELYWNVTGHGWTFPIDRAEAVIDLPPGADISQYAAYTGPTGSRGQDFLVEQDGPSHIVFTTTKALEPGEGLTVAVAWPKGVVKEPTSREKLVFLWQDNAGATVVFLGLVLVLVYYLAVWFRVGRDPARGTIIPLFSPPSGFSPAAVRFLTHFGFDQQALVAAVVNLAVKGCLTIRDEDGEFTLVRQNQGQPDLSPGEAQLLQLLFARGDTLVLKDNNHAVINGAQDALKKSLARELTKIYFITNAGYFAGGLALTLVTLALLVLSASSRPSALFISLWLSIWTVGCYALGVMVWRRWRTYLRGGSGWKNLAGTLGLSLFFLPFLAGEIVGLVLFSYTVSLPAGTAFLLLVFVNALFGHLLKAPTLKGRQILDQIEGFKLYLSVAEQERLNLLHPPERTPALFEKYLPYALALDVANEWSEQFAGVLAQAGANGTAYVPVWYSGRSWDSLGPSGLTDSLSSSFAGAIASSASPPGSVSGSGGGGFSGGGGGGGGGSGW
ncbi:MAG: DUF2207 domain-containing protein [Thermodesulfobacteriota bacterium]